jgi:hypothetical protein
VDFGGGGEGCADFVGEFFVAEGTAGYVEEEGAEGYGGCVGACEIVKLVKMK